MHHLKCVEFNEQINEANRKLVAQWPKICIRCGGTGGWELGGTYYDPPEWQECTVCIQEGICPRCAEPFPEDDEDFIACRKCGWSIDAPGLILHDGSYDCLCDQEWREKHGI